MQALKAIILVTLLLGLLAPLPVHGQTPRDQNSPKPKATEPDNTRTNQRTQKNGQLTAENQSQARSDREITRKIRRAIVKDNTLSTYAKNIKIITRNGTVTLKGPVRSQDEKKNVETKAAAIAGAANVKNELEIAAK